MITVALEPDERLANYLIRCQLLARTNGEPVRGMFEDVNFVVTPGMNPSEVVDAYFNARMVLRALKKDSA